MIFASLCWDSGQYAFLGIHPVCNRLDVGTSSGLIESIRFRRWPDHDQTLIDCGRAMSRA
jgi:hypothetical protein